MTDGCVRLGLMPPLTGLVGIYGAEVARAGQIACSEVNECGGVLGRPLELVVEDDGSLPESAVAAADRLVTEHRCVAIVGNLLSNSRIAVAYRVAEPRRIPYLNFSFYEGSILSRYFFHFAALPNQQIDRMIPFMREKHGPRMFFAGNNYEWPRGSIDAAKRALAGAGGEAVGEEYCPIGVTAQDIDRLLDLVAAASPDVFVPYFAGDDQLRLLTRFAQRGMKARMVVVMGHYDEIMASHLPPQVREGFYSCNTYFMSVPGHENDRMLKRLAAWPGVDGVWPRGDGVLTNFGEGAYLCVKAFAQAANQAGSLHPEALADALATVETGGPQGRVRMDPATHHARVNAYLASCRADGGFDVVKAFGAIEPVLPERYRHLHLSREPLLEEDIRLQSRMLEQMSEAVLLAGADNGIVIYANPGAERMFGYGRGELVGRPLAALTASGTMPGDEAAAGMMALLYQKGSWEGEIRNARRDGSRFWCKATVSAFTHPVRGEVWMVVERDISEIRRLHDELEQRVAERTAELQTANDELEAFSYSVSHDLRAPLRAIDGFSQILLEDHAGRLDEDGRHCLEAVRRNASRMGQLIDDILDFARMSRCEMGRAPVDVGSLAQEVFDDLRSAAPERNVQLRLGRLPRARGDRALLRQVFVNLLSNAVKFTAARSEALIELDGAVAEHGNVYRLKDNGVGFDMQYADKLFGVFQRLHSANEFEGTGIGLAIVKRIVARHGGRVWAESKPGEGATISFSLPPA